MLGIVKIDVKNFKNLYFVKNLAETAFFLCLGQKFPALLASGAISAVKFH